MKLQFEAEGNKNILWGRQGNLSIYASVDVPNGASEDYGYLALKKAVIEALEPSERTLVTFWYDGQEQYLADDARDGDVTVEIEREE